MFLSLIKLFNNGFIYKPPIYESPIWLKLKGNEEKRQFDI